MDADALSGDLWTREPVAAFMDADALSGDLWIREPVAEFLWQRSWMHMRCPEICRPRQLMALKLE
jgi:hypothetical protein